MCVRGGRMRQTSFVTLLVGQCRTENVRVFVDHAGVVSRPLRSGMGRFKSHTARELYPNSRS